MANTYSAPNFEVDTDTDIATLETLKGSAIATTDNIYVFNNAIVTVEKSVSLLNFYINDNVAGDAVVKTGYVKSTTGGIVITLNTTVAHTGLNGKVGVGNGYYSFIGSAGNLITIRGINLNKVSDYGARSLANVYKYCEFNYIFLMAPYSEGYVMENCNFVNSVNYAIYLNNIPLSFLNNSITDPPATCSILTLLLIFTKSEMDSLLSELSIICSTTRTPIFTLKIPFPIGTNYLSYGINNVGTTSQLDRIEQKIDSL